MHPQGCPAQSHAVGGDKGTCRVMDRAARRQQPPQRSQCIRQRPATIGESGARPVADDGPGHGAGGDAGPRRCRSPPARLLRLLDGSQRPQRPRRRADRRLTFALQKQNGQGVAKQVDERTARAMHGIDDRIKECANGERGLFCDAQRRIDALQPLPGRQQKRDDDGGGFPAPFAGTYAILNVVRYQMAHRATRLSCRPPVPAPRPSLPCGGGRTGKTDRLRREKFDRDTRPRCRAVERGACWPRRSGVAAPRSLELSAISGRRSTAATGPFGLLWY